MIRSATTLVLLLNTVFLLVLTFVAWRNRDEPGAGMFGVLQLLSAVWAATTVVGLSLPEGPMRIQVWGVTTGLSLLVVAFWLAFILRYTGRDSWLTLPRFGVASIPLVVGAALYFVAPERSPLVGRVEQGTIPAGTIVDASISPVGAAIGAYIYLVFLIGLVLVVKTVLQGDTPFVGQALALVLGTLVTVFGSALAIAGVPVAGYPVTQVALGGQAVLWGYAVFRQQFIRMVPAVARIGERAVFSELDDGVVISDGSGVVIRANPKARAFLGAETLVGTSVASLLDRLGVSDFDGLPTRFEGEGRTYQARSSTLTNWRGDPIGQALVIRDISRLVGRQQRLQVLNRILRHNVRNDMSVVLALGEQLQQSGDEELAGIGETLCQRAKGLTTVSEKALEIERLSGQPADSERINLGEFVDGIVSELVDQHPDARVTVSVEAGTMWTDPGLLSLVFEEVVENALVHAGDAPEVDIEVSRSNDRVEFEVVDDGPGIPQMEIDTVAAGAETDLQHASSLGLWLVYWGTRSLGGDVDITTTERGSTVRLSVQDLEEYDTADFSVPAEAGAASTI